MSIADVFECKARYAVVEGSCLDVMSESGRWTSLVDHVITDPPYSPHVHANMRTGSDFGSQVLLGFDSLSDVSRCAVGGAIARLCRRWALVFCDIENAMEWRHALEPPMEYVRVCFWRKPNPQPQQSGDRPGVGCEPFVAAHAKGRKRWNGGGKAGEYTHQAVTGAERLNKAQKPLPLMIDLVRDFTDDNDIVLDPFCGSGTTGEACLRLGRRFVGIEIDDAMAKIAADRLRDVDEEVRVERGERITTTKPRQIGLFK